LNHKGIFRGDARWTLPGPKCEAYYRGLTPCCDDSPFREGAASSPPRSTPRFVSSWAYTLAVELGAVRGRMVRIRLVRGIAGRGVTRQPSLDGMHRCIKRGFRAPKGEGTHGQKGVNRSRLRPF
jgi:hypothetical protein